MQLHYATAVEAARSIQRYTAGTMYSTVLCHLQKPGLSNLYYSLIDQRQSVYVQAVPITGTYWYEPSTSTGNGYLQLYL